MQGRGPRRPGEAQKARLVPLRKAAEDFEIFEKSKKYQEPTVFMESLDFLEKRARATTYRTFKRALFKVPSGKSFEGLFNVFLRSFSLT